MAQIIYWKINNGTLYIRGDSAQNYSEASMVNKPAASSWPWHNNRSDIINVVIETDISLSSMQYCFYQCVNLVSFTIQPSCSIIDLSSMQSCFEGCTSFNQSITIPNSVSNMSHCFQGCTSFNQPIVIPNNAGQLSECFRGCTSFNQPITIPNKVVMMNSCFYNCTSLNSTITINTDSSSYTYIFTGTSLPIYIKGISKNLNSIANEYSNVSVKRSFLYRILHYLTQLDAECDYLARIVETYVNVATTFSSVLQSNLSGVTASTHSEYLIGNYLSVRAVINVNSTAQSTIGKGNVTNRVLCTIKIPDFYYPSSGDTSYASLTNEQRFTRVSSVASYAHAIPTGSSSGNAQPATFYIAREYDGHNVLIHFTIAANIVSTTQYELCAIVPVTRIPFNYSEV